MALAYCPRVTRAAFTVLLALDARLAGIVRSSREPILSQLRLAWWRDQIAKPAEERKAGEPLLAALTAWPGDTAGLAGLVDGWEALLVGSEPPIGAISQLAEARAAAVASLATAGNRTQARRMAKNWALADLSSRLSDPAVRLPAIATATAQDWHTVILPRGLRPLQVLYGLSRRDRGRRPLLADRRAFLIALRLGLIGR